MDGDRRPINPDRKPKSVHRLAALVRWREWSDSKLPMFLIAMFYAGLALPAAGTIQLGQMAALLILLCLYAAFGHLVNDYADRASDAAAGKHRLLSTWSEGECRLALAAPCVAAIAIAALALDRWTAALTAGAFLTAALYSLPPVRLKERGLLGWAAATLAQRTLPVSMVFEAFGVWDWTAIGYALLSTLIGLRFIIIHQLRDATNDRRSGVRTVATTHSPLQLVAVLYAVFLLEAGSAVIVIAAMARHAPFLAPVAIAYALYLIIQRLRGVAIDPAAYFVFGAFYHGIWPVTLGLALAARNPIFAVAPLIVLALVQHQILRPVMRAFTNRSTSGPAPG